MNADDMCAYIEYVADHLMNALGFGTLYDVQNPFGFMELISLQPKANFFERRVGEYQKAGVLGGDPNSRVFCMDDDF